MKLSEQLKQDSDSGDFGRALKGYAERAAELEEIVKAVAHVGVDFGYGKYEIQPEVIDKARAIYERGDV